MAGQFDVAGDRVNYSASNPPVPSAGISFAGWVRIDVDRNDFSTLLRLHAAGGGSTTLTIGTGSDGVTMQVFSAGGSVVGAAAVVGDWYRVGYTLTGTDATLYLADVDGPVQVFTGTVAAGATPTGLTIAGRSAGDSDEPLTGTVAYARIWAAVLNQAGFEAEWDVAAAARTADLWADWPLAADLLDISGNGRHLTGGPPAFVEGPPLPDAETGALAATLPALTASAAASATSTTDLAATLPGLTAAAAGTSTSTAVAAATLPPLVGDLAAIAASTAALAATLPALSAAMGPAPDQHDITLTASLAAQTRYTAALAGQRWTASLGAQP